VKHLKQLLFRLLAALSALLLILSLSLAVVLNSGVIDNWAREAGMALFNKELQGRLESERVELKFPDRITLVRPRLYEQGERVPALEAGRITARFNVLSLLRPELTSLHFRRLGADSLRVRAIEREGGRLNLEVIFTPREPDSTKRGIEEFSCRRLRLQHASLSYATLENDGKAAAPKTAFLASDLDLRLSSFALGEGLLKGELRSLALSMPQEGFRLKEASARFLVTDRRAELIGLDARGGESRLQGSVSLDGVDLFHFNPETAAATGSSFINLRSLELDSRDIKKLAPGLELPSGTYTLQGNLKGNTESSELLDFALTHDGSRLKLKGELINLTDSRAFAYRVRCDTSRVSGELLSSLAPRGAAAEAALRSGGITFTGTAEGSLEGVKTKLAFRTEAGAGSLEALALKNPGGSTSASGSLELEGFEPHRILAMDGIESTLNLRGTFSGALGKEGLERAKADIALQGSRWHRQPIEAGKVKADYRDGRLRVDASFDDRRSTKLTLEGTGEPGKKEPAYSLTASMQGIDLARLVPASTYATDLNGVAALKGSGFDPSTLNMALSVRFEPSSLNGLRLRGGSRLSAEIAQSGGASKISLQSDFLDLGLQGNYSLEQLSALASYAARAVTEEVSRENLWQKGGAPAPASSPALERPFTVNYSVNVRESAPLELLLPLGGTSFRGSAVGRAASSRGHCSITSSVDVPSLALRASDGASGTAMDQPLTLGALNMQAALECGSNGISTASLTGRVGALDALGRKTGNASFSARYAPSSLSMKLEASVPDPATRVAASVEAVRTGAAYRLRFNTLSLADSSGTWGLEGMPVVRVDRSAMRFERFTLSKGSQRVVLDGALSEREAGTFTAALTGFELNDLQRFTLDPSLAPLSGTLDATVRVEGAPASKTTTLELQGRKVRYERFQLGGLRVSARHRGSTLGFSMQSGGTGEDGAAVNTITGSGTVPLELGYFPLSLRVPEGRPVKASFNAPDLSAEVLAYALPFFASAEGRVPTVLRVEGRTPSPDIHLTSTLRGTKIRVAPTEVDYTLDGEIVLTPRQLELRRIAIRDAEGGSGTIQGTLQLHRLEPGALSLDMRLRRLLLYDKKDKKDETSLVDPVL